MVGLTMIGIYQFLFSDHADGSALLETGEAIIVILLAVAVSFLVPMLLNLRRLRQKARPIHSPRKLSPPKPVRRHGADNRN